MVNYWVGGHELDDARQFVSDMAGRMTGKPLFVSDELPHYAQVLAEEYHDLVSPPPTGKPGRPRNPVRVVHADLDYATVRKTREAGRVVRVRTAIVYGDDNSVAKRIEQSPSNTINTAYVERANLNWRMCDAHLRRKSPTFAKARRWLRAKFAIAVAHHDFIRPHSALGDRNNPATPAMKAGVTSKPWTLDALIRYPCLCQ